MFWNKSDITFNNCACFPDSLRCLIFAPSGSGKTSLVLTLLTGFCEKHNQDYLEFKKLVICSPSIEAEQYQMFIKAIQNGFTKNNIRVMFEQQDEINDFQQLLHDFKRPQTIELKTYTDSENLPPIQKLSKSLVILDDCLTQTQNRIYELFTRGRPLGIQTIYISQSFYNCHKRLIRDQCNFFIFFETSYRDMKSIYQHIAGNIFENETEFYNFCKNIWCERYRYITINRETKEVSDSLNNMYGKDLNTYGKDLNTYRKDLNTYGSGLTLEQLGQQQLKAYKSSKCQLEKNKSNQK